jgi:tRNA-2-methylthio-N6-dimethylallyladenosine synthase
MSDLLQLEDLTQVPGDTHRPTLVERESVDYKLLANNVGRIGEGKKYHIKTYGCQMNEHDTEIMAGMLEEMGYTSTANHDDADFILFNTCAVREGAESKVFGEIGRLKPLKNRNPELILGLCGCMAQEEVVQKLVEKTYPWVDMVFGTHNLHQLPELLDRARNSQETIFEVWEKAGDVVENLPKMRKDGIRAWVNIQYGCNKFCTYCIVPYTRGRERSRLLQDVVGEVKELAAQGYKEITLLGQNVNDYGIDLKAYDFADLLAACNEVEGIERIRFTTSNPWNFTDKLIETIARSNKVSPHIHLPVQSGDNTILRRMNRGYTREFYLDLVGRIRTAMPNVSLTTDIIVGFPGETEEQFEETLALIEQVRFDGAYTFIYSPRAGTPATRFREQVSDADKKSRLQRLMDVQNEISRENNDLLKEQLVEVLVEGESKTNSQVLQGRTGTNKLVLFNGPAALKGQVVQVRVTEPQTWLLKGELVAETAEMAV